MKLDRFLAVLNAVAPAILLAVPNGDKIAAVIPQITHGIAEAQQMKGATGPEKKAHAMSIANDAVQSLNATGKVKLDSNEVQAVASHGIDAVVGTIHVIDGAKVVKVPTA